MKAELLPARLQQSKTLRKHLKRYLLEQPCLQRPLLLDQQHNQKIPMARRRTSNQSWAAHLHTLAEEKWRKRSSNERRAM